MLAAYDLSLALDAEARVVTWGSPRLGDKDFRACYLKVVKHTARFVNKFDPVPRVPPDPAEPATNDADAVSAFLASLLRRQQEKFGAVGFCSVCPSYQLDDGVASSLSHWAAVANKIAGSSSGSSDGQGEAHTRASLVPHGMPVYEANLRRRLEGGTTDTATAAAQLGSAVSSIFSAVAAERAKSAASGGTAGYPSSAPTARDPAVASASGSAPAPAAAGWGAFFGAAAKGLASVASAAAEDYARKEEARRAEQDRAPS